MPLTIRSITFDCADARGLATFWADLLGWNVYYDDDPEVLVAPHYPYPGTELLFIPVPEGKTAKNRLHLDLGPTDARRDDAVERALTSGASVLADHRNEDGTGWVTLADPEGNEFCIVRGDLERPVSSQTFRLGS
jgi:predicted enzyme related to lactoylglutathione lyase